MRKAVLFYLGVISYAAGIISIIMSLIAILSPHGVIYYENNIIIKIIESITLSVAIGFLFDKLFSEYKKRDRSLI